MGRQIDPIHLMLLDDTWAKRRRKEPEGPRPQTLDYGSFTTSRGNDTDGLGLLRERALVVSLLWGKVPYSCHTF